MTDIHRIPLNKLVVSPDNARKNVSDETIASMAASLQAHGQQQVLIVRKKGKTFEIIDGQIRYLADMLRVQQGDIDDDHAMLCRIDESDTPAIELSLVANTMREDMHEADKYEAMRALADMGHSDEAIAARFGCEKAFVAQLLKLGRLSPKIRQLHREDKLPFDIVMALTLTDDHARQEQLVKDAPKHWRARDFRQALLENDLPYTDPRVKFVTLKAYEKEGGNVKTDLFADFGGGKYVTDIALIDRLVSEKLDRATKPVRKENWKWVETRTEFGFSDKRAFDQISGTLTEALSAELTKLQDEYETISDSEEEGHDKRRDEIAARVEEIELSREYTPEQKATAGVIVTIGEDGKTEIIRGLIKPEDMPKDETEAAATDDDTGSAEPPPPEQPSEFSAGLIENLTAQKSAALSATLIDAHTSGFRAVGHALASDVFFRGASGRRALQITLREQNFGKADGSKAVEKIEAAHEAWREKLPDAEGLWQWCMDQPTEDVLALIDFCAALCIDGVQTRQDKPHYARLVNAGQLAQELKLDMTEWFTPTADNYFNHVTKDKVVEAITEKTGQPPAPALLKLKKGELAKEAERVVSGTGWLPKPLRPAV